MRVFVRSSAKLAGNTDGAAAIEFALLVPMLIVLVICTADLGFGIYRYMQVENAAQAGVTYAAARGFSEAQVSAAVLSATTYPDIQASPAPTKFCGCPSGTSITSAVCTSTCSDGSQPGTYVSASAKATYNTIVPYPMLPTSYDFAAQATVRIQ
jgi:Flp pilus assembly protein TadG